MTRVLRHDAITLHSTVKQEDFEKFMKDVLIPYFSDRYRGPTRVSIADIKSQSLLKDTNDPRQWLWVTMWDGSPDSVRGSSFEHTRMSSIKETEDMLKKLESFGDRSAEKVFSEVETAEAATNS